jgi:N-acetylglucosaminyldiphosphoundecaprenol N-acetyl-beta-D-mannosaminyltransferase
MLVAPERPWKRRKVLDLPVDLVCREDVLRAVPAMVRTGGTHHLVALNPIKVMRAQEEKDLRAGIEEAALVYPDAVGIAWALRVLYGERQPVLPGCELMVDLLALADEQRFAVYLVGARPDVVTRMAVEIGRRYPGIRLAGTRDGYFDDAQRDAVIGDVLAARPDLLFVAMGAHRQETFVRALPARGDVPVVMTVGGSFDAFVGAVRRPPRWLLRLRLEWLYRLVRQPFRAPRMLALPRFVCRVLRLRYARHGSP